MSHQAILSPKWYFCHATGPMILPWLSPGSHLELGVGKLVLDGNQKSGKLTKVEVGSLSHYFTGTYSRGCYYVLLYIPGGYLGFLKHQQYVWNPVFWPCDSCFGLRWFVGFAQMSGKENPPVTWTMAYWLVCKWAVFKTIATFPYTSLLILFEEILHQLM